METLEELKAIIDNAPEGAKSISEHVNAYVKRHDGNFYWWDGECWQKLHCHIETRLLSDIERIIELMDGRESKKEECKHLSSTASYTHITCDSCYMIRTDGGWGCASRKWFDNIESAKFYEKNGFLPR